MNNQIKPTPKDTIILEQVAYKAFYSTKKDLLIGTKKENLKQILNDGIERTNRIRKPRRQTV